MTDDITGDLDLLGDWLVAKGYGEEAGLCTRTMDYIHKQAAQKEKLRAALKPFAACVDQPAKIYEHEGVRMVLVDYDVLIRVCRAAAAALEETGDE